jgi:type IV pilus assembly protein PilQ
MAFTATATAAAPTPTPQTPPAPERDPSSKKGAPAAQGITRSPELSPSARFLRSARDAQPWTGKPISLNLKDADLADLLKTFAGLTGLNLVVYPEVRGTVTVSLRDVPWDQALDLILRINGYGYVIEGNVVRIGPLKRIAE